MRGVFVDGRGIDAIDGDRFGDGGIRKRKQGTFEPVGAMQSIQTGRSGQFITIDQKNSCRFPTFHGDAASVIKWKRVGIDGDFQHTTISVDSNLEIHPGFRPAW